MTRTFVVGLDGASWLLTKPWVDEGLLPNLAELRQTGTYATSQSCLPPVTYPNWKCYSSGKNPGKHSVYWWERINLADERIDIMSGRDYKTAELWDYLNADGQRVGVINMPSMYPPREIDGYVVSGGPDAVEGEYRSLDSGYTFPSEFESELTDRYEYQVHPDPLLSSNEELGAEVDEILRLLELRLEVARDLFLEENLEFTHVTLFYLNVLHHFFWDDKPTKRAWQLVDEWLGELDKLENVNLVIMSDHGAAPTTTEFYVNEWLAENGYLVRTSGVEDYLQRFGLTRENALNIAKRFGIVDFLAKNVPEVLQEIVPQSAGAKRERKMELIDPQKTKALASGQGPIYLNSHFDVESVREQLIADLKRVTDNSGNSLFADVYRAEEVYDGPYVDIGPDVVVDQRPGVHVNDGMGGDAVMTEPDRWAAENTPKGIFVANGPDFRNREEISDIDIRDIAPTLLANHGVDVPTDMDGDVLDIFIDSPEVGTQAPIDHKEINAGGASDEVVDRLTELGYME
ncbi:alkaline phosphatase family protein [Halorubrum ezzemoulense]|jgi:predicted AlkP superfamily phosphohydrolase/phosphomutase|uniref:alkaline phosphatase family protein n=1 Tax=Halorubrum ezzemoulense TaxID=337243 RepID=UPI00233102B6|nr:alkaline phosphatase family protein [Halorubrum ezzemoulense]MDB2236978.1 alkaline phosphatase family protein [Halorubrum ezzemoulense]MDB2241492.1 alkaline phosphatase family protein [Halorubrum ezzemoulense]MDB2247033.1 alkaline phosphatase family protein [Halorubrum ezzemoulense]